jgi:putative intracellular protease/amidase
VLVVVAPTDCDVRAVRKLWQLLHPLGVLVAVTQECHGEARGEDGAALYPNCLLIEVRPESWDALVFAGGRGAIRVAEDRLAREVAERAAASGRVVAALGAGAEVLAAAHVQGLCTDEPRALAQALAARWSLRTARHRPTAPAWAP